MHSGDISVSYFTSRESSPALSAEVGKPQQLRFATEAVVCETGAAKHLERWWGF